MIRNALRSITEATRSLLRNWQVAAVFSGVYATLVAACYLFATTTEARIMQVLFTLTLALSVIVLFYMFQTMSVSYTRRAMQPNGLVRHALKNFWRLMLVTLPLILLTWIIVYLINRIPSSSLTNPHRTTAGAWFAPVPYLKMMLAQQAQWRTILSASLRLMLYGIALPLAAVHLWIAAAHDGLKQTFKGAGRITLRAFRPQPVLIYTIGLVIFGLIPCLLLFIRTPASNAWLEIGLLTARLILAFIFFLFGWVITLGALTEMNRTKEEANAYAA